MSDRRQIRISADSIIADRELEWRFGPSGGPGGQHANTTNSRVELVWEISDAEGLTDDHKQVLLAKFGPRLRVVVDQTRSQARNRDLALDKLSDRVREALIVRPKRRRTKPSRGANERRLREKKKRSQRKTDRRRDFD